MNGPSERPDADQERRRQLAIWAVVSPIPVTLALAAQSLLSDAAAGAPDHRLLVACLGLSITPASLFGVWMLRAGRSFSAVIGTFLCYVFVTVGAIAFLRAGILGSSPLWLLVIATGAMLTAGARAGTLAIAASATLVAGFYGLHELGMSNGGVSSEQAQLRWLIDLTAVGVLLLVEVAIFERNKQQAFEVLRGTNAELRIARDQADAANRSKSAFLANVSHEIRSPMTSILGFTDVVRERSPFARSQSEIADDLDTVRRNGLHLLAIINDILDISKIESGRFELDCSTFSPAQLAEDVASLMRVRADSCGIGLHVKIHENLPRLVVGDAKRIKQVLLNLVGNAIKFTREGSVRLYVTPLPSGPPGALAFDVEDDGIGMSSAQIAGLFTAFSQADASTARLYGGTGLGLAICKRLVELMDGRIHVESQPNVGSRFRVELPTRTADAAEETSEAPEPTHGRRRIDELEGRLLVVDDLEDNRTLLAHLLRPSRLELEFAESGEEACARIGDRSLETPHVILMDLRMGGMDGFEATARIRGMGYAGHVLALTAHALSSERDRCLESGFDDYLTKPVDLPRLVDALAKHLAPRAPEDAAGDPAEGPSTEPPPDLPASYPARAPRSFLLRLRQRWIRLREFFVPDSSRVDPADLARARFITTFCLLPLPLIPAWAALFPLIVERTLGIQLSIMLALVTPLFVAIPMRLRRGRSIRAPLHLLLSYLYLMFGALTAITGGLGSAATFWIAMLPVVAVAVVGVLPGVVWAGLCIAQFAGFYALPRLEVVLPNVLPADNLPFTMAVSLTSVLCLMGAFAYLYERTATEALRSYGRTYADLVQARDQADLANRSKSEFVANISHELRTPMTAILGFTDVLIDHWPRTEEERPHVEALTTVRRNGQHLLEIINDILDLSKIEAGKIDITQETLDPRALAQEILELMQIRADQKRIELGLELETPVPEAIQGDSLRIRQILVNILGNAIKFTETGAVTLRLALRHGPSGPRLRFAVTDTGIGISRSQLRVLFEPFQQADASISRTYGGTGLGLAICKRLAELMGGRISAHSTLGAGATFVVEIPTGDLDGVRLSDSLDPLDAPEPEAIEQSAQIRIDGRVLLVDDSPDNQRLLSLLLTKAGARVEIASNGRTAVQRALDAEQQREPFDIVLMDLQMPILDGYSAIRLLRSDGYERPIVALSAHAMAEARDRAIACGATRYATKPVQKARLLSLIRELIAAGRASC